MTNQRSELKQQRELGDILRDAWALHRAGIGVYAVVVAPFVLFGILITLLTYLITENPELQLLVSLAFLPLDVLVYQLVASAVVAVVKAGDEGRRISAGDALDIAQDHAADVLQVAIRLALATLAAFTIIGLYWGMKKLVQWSLAISALILDDLRWNEAIFRSEKLVEGRWWATFGRLLVAGLLLYIPAFLLGSVLSVAVSQPFGTIVASLPYLLTTSFPIIATVLIYADRKSRTNLFP